VPGEKNGGNSALQQFAAALSFPFISLPAPIAPIATALTSSSFSAQPQLLTQ
jgi:hypothetical protein